MSTSTQAFTKETISKLDVIPIFNDLMKASTDKDSLYIKSKRTIQDIFEDGKIDAGTKAKLVTDVISNLTIGITNSAMAHAVEIAKERQNAPYRLAKEVADIKLTQEQTDKLAGDNKLTDAQIAKMEADTVASRINGWKTQADIYTKNGINTTTQNINNSLLTSVAQLNPLALDKVQAEQVKAAKFSALASTFRRDGSVTWTIDANQDITGMADSTPTGTKLLTVAQTDVAIRQEKGFDDNMRQHAANSSANMIGLLLSSENYGVITAADVDKWRSAVDYLNAP